ncbi:MAG TPA: hypothetical protein VFH61_15885 [Thermoleophilia bacterium]|nr:hypothetical protein [Thermoleophilia bacterium]
MSEKHTQGELAHTPGAIWKVLRDERGNPVAEVGYGPEALCEANARRLVAGWNACEGIPTESLETGCVNGLVEALDLIETAAGSPGHVLYTTKARMQEVAREALASIQPKVPA